MNTLILIIGALVILGLTPIVVLRARALNRRIQEHLCEEEQRPKDPYAQMAEIAKVQDALSRQKGDSWPKA